MTVHEKLFYMQDLKYRDFQLNLTPGMKAENIIGVRTPELRKLAKEMIKSGESENFISVLPHRYFEENQLHAFILSEIKEYEKAVQETDRFLPYVDNWATCDQLRPKIFKKNTGRLTEKIKEWISSDRTYTIRFGIEMLMNFYLDENFFPESFNWVTGVQSEEYYVNMMKAWYFATALAKQYDPAVKVIEEKKLDIWTHNKTIQKARESFRVSEDHKEYLMSLKIKK